MSRLGSSDKDLAVIPGATHLFEEKGTLSFTFLGKLEEAAQVAINFVTRLTTESLEE